MAQETMTVYPSSYDSTNYSYASVNSSHPLSNPVGKGSSNTTYAEWNLTTGYGAKTYVFYIFDLSAIPSDATINSVSCVAKGYVSNTSSWYISSRTMQMYYGTNTAKGSSVNLTTSASEQTLDCGTWTREELNDCRIRIYASRSFLSTSSSRSQRFYGATLTIEYTLPSGEQFMLKTSGAWSSVSKVYKKVNGSWVEQTDLASLFDTNTKYVKKDLV